MGCKSGAEAEDAWKIAGLPVTRNEPQVHAVMPKQIAAYAHKHLDGAGNKVVVVGDAAQFGDAIRQAHSQAVLLQSTVLDLDSPCLQPVAPAVVTTAR